MGISDPSEQAQTTTATTTSSPAAAATTDDYLYEERSKPCFLWTLILAPCLLPVVWEYHVTVTTTELSFGYSSGCMKKVVTRSDIVSVEIVDHINGFMDWGGYGIRKQLPSWDTGYIPRNGPGVRMVMKHPTTPDKEISYTFSCHDPNAVVNILTA